MENGTITPSDAELPPLEETLEQRVLRAAGVKKLEYLSMGEMMDTLIQEQLVTAEKAKILIEASDEFKRQILQALEPSKGDVGTPGTPEDITRETSTEIQDLLRPETQLPSEPAA